MTYKVYLAGTMTSNENTFNWRIHAEREFKKYGIQSLSPFRGKSITHLKTSTNPEPGKSGVKDDGTIEFADYSELTAGISSNRIVARDFADVRETDILLANLTNTIDIRPSIGTISECAWAFALHKPVICIVDSTTNDNYYKHPFMQTFIHHWVDSVEKGIDAIINYWSPVAD